MTSKPFDLEYSQTDEKLSPIELADLLVTENYLHSRNPGFESRLRMLDRYLDFATNMTSLT